MPFFSGIFVSMGDNQSIAMHLSTYSARLSEQKSILEEGGAETLAVIDEPAAGTDPSTGTALAAVFLETVADAGVRAVVSTHMGQLKLLAMDKPGFVNGSMSFNPETLTPGYRFIPNLPGASCTLEAAAIAGFPEALLNRASELAGDSFSLDSLVASLRELEEERNSELQELKNQRERFAVEKSKLLKNLEAACTRTEETRLQGELERSEALRRIQSRADSLLATMAGTGDSVQRLEARRKLSDIAEREAISRSREVQGEAVRTPVEFAEGDRVSVRGWPDTGTVEKAGRSSAMVRLGSMLLKKELTELTIVDTPAERTVAVSEYTTPSENPEAMLLGLTIDEAVAELDIKLDNCTASGLKRLRVIHGKGRLMKGVTDWLRRDRRVSTVSMAAPEEGGTGASIVIVKG
jgi:DNA mismatch repair protein MutS2